MDSFQITFYILLAAVAYCFFGGLFTRNYSQVDRLWSVLPPVYVLIWMKDFSDNPRYVIAAVLVILWGIRLTTNFALKGGYAFSWRKGFYGEDYRWDVLKAKIPNRFLYELFNLFFISGFQLGLIFLFTLPVYYLGSVTGPLNGLDFILVGLHLILLIGEMTADIQQLSYYRRRGDEKEKNNRRIQLGFNTLGLWKYSRHPNYVCELGQWFIVYFYLHSRIGFHYTFAGPAVLLALFLGSTIMAESITSEKYEGYRNWKKMTAPWIPFLSYLPERKNKKEFLKEK
ncbi:MAG: DUF1295 domain-containing protein [Spirochaetales bacterium]|nr:DUF1295 domain-containing protein [Spirochaetales bacterium]